MTWLGSIYALPCSWSIMTMIKEVKIASVGLLNCYQGIVCLGMRLAPALSMDKSPYYQRQVKSVRIACSGTRYSFISSYLVLVLIAVGVAFIFATTSSILFSSNADKFRTRKRLYSDSSTLDAHAAFSTSGWRKCYYMAAVINCTACTVIQAASN